MKKINYISMFFCSLFLLMACEKETENTSSILHFELKGDARMLVSLGTSYEEPGYLVTYRNEDVSKNIQIIGSPCSFLLHSIQIHLAILPFTSF